MLVICVVSPVAKSMIWMFSITWVCSLLNVSNALTSRAVSNPDEITVFYHQNNHRWFIEQWIVGAS